VHYIMPFSYKVGTMISVVHWMGGAIPPFPFHGVYSDTFTLPLIQSSSPLQNANNNILIFSNHSYKYNTDLQNDATQCHQYLYRCHGKYHAETQKRITAT
jgi:hypothetical protein